MVSVIPRPITKSDCVASLTLNLAEKYALLLVLNLKPSPLSCKKSKSLSPAAFVSNKAPPADEVTASVALPVPASVVVIVQSPEL